MPAVMPEASPRIASPIIAEQAVFDHSALAANADPSTIGARIRGGDRTADAEMVERYEKHVRNALRRLVPNPADRQDLAQDVWLVALIRIRRGELREPKLLLAFLIGIARALAANERRRCIRRATVPDSSAVEEYPDESGGPADAVERAQCRQLAVKAINSLHRKHYREVLLRSVTDQDKSQTCADLGIDAIQYSRILYKAKDRLREVITQSTKPPWPPRRESC